MDLREPLGSGTGVSGPGARGPEKIHPSPIIYILLTRHLLSLSYLISSINFFKCSSNNLFCLYIFACCCGVDPLDLLNVISYKSWYDTFSIITSLLLLLEVWKVSLYLYRVLYMGNNVARSNDGLSFGISIYSYSLGWFKDVDDICEMLYSDPYRFCNSFIW